VSSSVNNIRYSLDHLRKGFRKVEETDERRTSNVQHRTSNECILSVLKKISRSDSILRRSSFDILRFVFSISCSFTRDASAQLTNQPINESTIYASSTINFCSALISSLNSAALSNSRSLAALSISFFREPITASISSSDLYAAAFSAT